MRKLLVIISILACCSSLSYGQTFYTGTEYGIAIGGSQYFGDLNDNYGFKYVRPAFGAFARYHLNPFISVRFSANYTKVGYDDRFSNNTFNRARNLSFRSDIVEGAIQTEFNFFRFATGELNSRWTPYLTGGVGFFYYNPYTTMDGAKYYLRPLGTEGQYTGQYTGRMYNTFSMCFPIGAGFKYWIRPGFNFGVEITDHLTVTDYLDDVSTTYVGADKFTTDPSLPNTAERLQDRSVNQSLGRSGKARGNSDSKDQYLMFMVNLSFQLKTYKCPSYLKAGYFMY